MEIINEILFAAEQIPNKFVAAGAVIIGAIIRHFEKKKLKKQTEIK